MQDGMYYAILKDNGEPVWRYFVPWEDMLKNLITDWIEYGFSPKGAKLFF